MALLSACKEGFAVNKKQDAVVEQKKIDKTILEKQQRLKQFQKDVQRRVTRVTRVQRQMVTRKQSENMKEEQDLLYRSVAAADNMTPKKNRCSYNVNQVTIDASGRLTAHHKPESPNKGCSTLSKQSSEIEKLHQRARKNLANRQLDGSAPESHDEAEGNQTLPGGFWGTSISRDKSGPRLIPPKHVSHDACIDAEEVETEEPHTITATAAPHDVAIAAVQEGIMSSPRIKSRIRKTGIEVTDTLPETLHSQDASEISSMASDKENHDEEAFRFNPAPASSLAPSTVHFRSGRNGKWKKQDVAPCDGQEARKVMITRMGQEIQRDTDSVVSSQFQRPRGSRPYGVPFAAPGVVEHERKKMDERNRLLCRRVFSDVERENVREERRRREHRCKVERLRAEKEQERIRMEQEHDKNILEATEKLEKAEIAKEMRQRKKMKKRQEKMDKQIRAKRFASALKAQIRERLEKNHVILPPLCCCSSTFWGTDPDTCANNCIFYRNTDAYTAALQSVLSSVEQNMPCKHEKIQDHSVISLLSND